jgi:hypothetical protein
MHLILVGLLVAWLLAVGVLALFNIGCHLALRGISKEAERRANQIVEEKPPKRPQEFFVFRPNGDGSITKRVRV